MSLPRPPQDRGAALLTMLMIVAVMSVAAVTALDALGRSLSLARVSSQRAQAVWAARSTEAIGAMAITRLNTLGQDAAAGSVAFDQVITLPFEGGVIQASLSDDSNCFNLNSVTGEPDSIAGVNFERLLVAAGLFRNEARTLADSLADWVDHDSIPRTFGAEDGHYATRDIPYRPANAPLANVSELRAIQGFTPEVIALIAPLVCVRPLNSQPTLNIETLTEADAPLLVALYSAELTTEKAMSAIRARPLAGWRDKQAFLSHESIASIAEMARNDTILALTPSHLHLTARIVSGSTQETLDLVYEVGKGGKPRLIQRTTGDS